MATKKAKPTTLNKSAFVRSLPMSLSAADVVQRAKIAGLKLSPRHVYVIRSIAKRKGKTLRNPLGRTRVRAVSAQAITPRMPFMATARATESADPHVQQLRRAAISLGLERAQAELDAFKTALQSFGLNP